VVKAVEVSEHAVRVTSRQDTMSLETRVASYAEVGRFDDAAATAREALAMAMETGYKVMRTDVARSLNLHANRFDIEPVITAKLLNAGHRIRELPVAYNPRSRVGGKRIRWRDGVQALRVLVKCRWAGGARTAGE
jgi:hypothetical protein